jgi:hypothetical protein
MPKPRDTTLAVPLPQHADSLLRDSLAKTAARDSARAAAAAARDTIQAPLAHAEIPPLLTIAQRLHWSRDSLFATGALTLADLLERVPAVTTLHAGWIASPAVAAYMGGLRRVRVFYDGFEQLSLDPRAAGLIDLTQINLWSAEDVTIEQAPEEIRVYIRTWRVQSTDPETRTDVSTGDQATNMYRGFFGRRFSNGLALQFGAQQFGTTPPQALGTGSDQTGIVARVGWARRQWNADAYITRIGRHRGSVARDPLDPGDSLPAVASTQSDSYLRFGYADPDTSRLWAQAMIVGSKYDYTGIRTRTIPFPKTAEDSAFNAASLDTSTFRAQYIVSAGTVRGPLRLSATDRVTGGGGHLFNTPSLRGSFLLGRLGVSAFLEGKSADSASHSDVTAQFTPLSFLSFVGSIGRTSDSRVPDSSFTANDMRAEAGIRVKRLWLVGGILRRDSIGNAAPRIFDTVYARRGDPSATGAEVAIRGQLWRILQADVSAIRWNDSSGMFRPRYQTRSELFLHTNMLHQFPSGNLGISASLVHEYRSGVNFPVAPDGVIAVPGYRTISSLLEIRVLSATVSWQFRNLLGERYAQVPGFLMPRQTNFYGVRWTFFD